MSKLNYGKSIHFSSNNDNSNSPKSNFDKIKLSLKTSIFGVLYTLTKDHNPNIIFVIILSLIEHLQLLSFLFHPSLHSSWSNSNINSTSLSVVKSLYKGINKLHIINYFESNASSLAYLLILYLFLLFIFIIIIIVIYITYSFNRGFFSLLWPISFLRFALMITMYILTTPIYRFYFSIFQCDNDNNLYIKSMKCYSGFHFIHIVAVAIALILFTLIVYVTSICFYNNYNYSDSDVSDINIRKCSKCDVYKLIIKLIFCIIDSIIESRSISNTAIWCVIIIDMAITINYVIVLVTNDIYVNSAMQKFNVALGAILAWESLSVMLTKFMNYIYSFDGGIIVFLFGVVMIICSIAFIAFTSKDNACEIISKEFTTMTKGEELSKQIRMTLALIEKRGNDRRSEMLLRGLVKYHEARCIYNDCPMKTIKTSFLTENFDKSPQVTTLLLNYISRSYMRGIGKFPSCISLRIEYIQFLFVYQKQRLKALNEIDNLLKSPLNFENDFIVFKIRKMITDVQEIDSSMPQSSSVDLLDNESSIAYDSHFRQCQSSILVSSKLFLDFWGMLANSSIAPDVYKLNALGEKINDCLKNINNHWNRMQHYKPNDSKALKMYLTFVSQILNDKEKAKDIIALAKGNNNIGARNENAMKKIENEYKDELSMGNGIVCISAENENFGTIMKATGNVSVIFGYLLSDIIGRNIDDFFIDAYNGGVSLFIKDKYHKSEDDKKETDNNILLSSEKLFYGKAHNSQINPIYLTVLNATSVNEKLQIKLIVRKQSISTLSVSNIDNNNNRNEIHSKFINKAIFIINSSLSIQSYNEDASILVNLTSGKFSHDNFNITYYFPELLRSDVAYNNNINYRIVDTILIEMFIDNLHNINNIDNSPVSRDIYISIRKKRKKGIIGNFNFFDMNNDKKEPPILSKITIDTLEGVDDTIEKYYVPPSSSNRHSNYQSDNNTESIVSPQVNYDNLYDAIKDNVFILTIEYSLSDRVMYSKNENEGPSMFAKDNEGNSPHNVFNPKMIDSPFLRINLDKILDEIEEEKKNKEIKNAKRRKDDNNDKGDNNNTNIMSYLKDKGKFAKLYNFEGIDISDYNLQNEKEFDGKTLTEIKRKNQMNEDNEQSQNENININDSEMKIEKQLTSKFNNSDDNNDNTKNMYDDLEGYDSNIIDDLNLSNIDLGESKNLLNMQSELSLMQLKAKIESLKDYSQNINLCIYNKNENIIPVKTPPTQINVFLELQENVASSSERNIFTSSSSNTTTGSSLLSSKTKTDKTLKSLTHLQISSLITVVLLVIYDIINFILNTNANDKTDTNISLIDLSYLAINHISFSAYILRNLLLSYNPLYTNYLNESSLEDYRNMNIGYLASAQKELDAIIIKISNSGLKLSDKHHRLIAENVVPIYFLSEDNVNYYTENRTLIQSLSDMRIYILTISNYPSQSLENNTLVNNLMYNSFNDFYSSLKQSAALYTELVVDNDKYYITVFTIMYVVIILISIVSIVINAKMLIRVDEDRTKILCAFYEIPQNCINDLSKKCIKFIEKSEKIKNINTNAESNDDDNESTDNENEDLIETDIDNNGAYENVEDRRKKHQRIKNIKDLNAKENRKTAIKVVITFLIVICVFMIDYIRNVKMFNNFDTIISIFNSTAQTESEYVYSLNILREKVLNVSFITMSKSDLFILNTTISNDYTLNNEVLINSIKSSNYFDSDITKKINNILNGDICSFITCNDDSLGQYGCEVITVRYFELLRLAIKAYVNKDTEENVYEILSNSLFKDITMLLHYYITPLYKILREDMKKAIEDKLKYEMNFRMILFIVFLVVVIIVYLIGWIPKQNRLNDEIVRTKKLLEIIPSEILDRIDSLKSQNK